MSIPNQYERFLTGFQNHLPTIARTRRPDLKVRFTDSIDLSQTEDRRHLLSLRHPTATLLWAFHQLESDRSTKTFGIDVARRGGNPFDTDALDAAWRISGLAGECGRRETDWWRAWQVWGRGQSQESYDRLIRDEPFIRELQTWAFDAMCVVIDAIDGRHLIST